jgi:hypothetical protein
MPAWIHSDPHGDDGHWRDAGLRECARAERCTDPQFVQVGVRTVRRPALTPRAFCDSCRDEIAVCVDELPRRWMQVHAKIGDLNVANGDPVSGSHSAPVPLSLDVDAFLRELVAVLVSWEERVRLVAGLTVLDTDTARRRRDGVAVTQACRIIGAHIDALLALPAEPMLRVVDIPTAATLPPGTAGVVRPVAGYAEVMRDLGGEEAGLEVLWLRARCRGALGLTKPRPKHLPVPCGACGFAELYEMVAWDGVPEGARCRQCGDEYTDNEFTLRRGEAYAMAQVRAEETGAGARQAVRPGGSDDVTSRRA